MQRMRGSARQIAERRQAEVPDAYLVRCVDVSKIREAYLCKLHLQRGAACRPISRPAGARSWGPPRGSWVGPAHEQGPLDALYSKARQVFVANMDARHRTRLLRNVLVPVAHKPKSQKTLIVFDWDDTLFPTGTLTNGCSTLPAKHNLPYALRATLEVLEEVVKDLLLKSMSQGTTIIITNAVSGWVETTAAAYMPSLLPVLEKIRVVSAQTTYDRQFPNNPAKWKAEAFLDVQRQLNPDTVMNMIAFGDADHEIDAAHALRRRMPQSVIKTLRFYQNPNPTQLLSELKYVRQRFRRLVAAPHSSRLDMPASAIRSAGWV